MKGRFWRKALVAALAAVVSGNVPIKPVSDLFGGMAITASAASAVDVPLSVDESSFSVITDVKILGDNSPGDMEDLVYNYKYERDGWTVIEQDLNQGAGGWYIYLAYKTETVTQQSDLSKAIRDIIIVKGSEYGKKTTLSGITDTTLSSTTSRTFYKCKSAGDFSNDTNQGDVGNLNRGTGAGTPDLYMYYTCEAGYDNSVLTSFSLNTSSSGSAYCYYNSGNPADLNPSSNAAYLHLSRKSVSASYYGFEASTDLFYNGSAQTLASPKSAHHGTVNWSVNGGSWTKSLPKATNAGEYTVKSYAQGDFGFGDSPEVSTTVTIAKSDANKPTVSIDSPIVTGAIYAPKIVGMAADRTGAVTFQYSELGTMSYTEEKPTAAGKYYVRAVIAEDANYKGYTTEPVLFRIDPTGSCGANATWNLNIEDGTLTISGTGAMDDYNGYGGTQPWFGYMDNITSVEIEKGITSIGKYAFYKCISLESMTIPDSVTSIGDWAFYNCTSLESITIPDSVTSIGNSAFYNCTSLASVEMSKNVTSIGNTAFYNCTSLTSITIPDSVTSIGNNAFCNCTSLTSVEMSKNITIIDYNAFYNCTSLTSVTIPNSVTSIGDDAFYKCTSLASITIPDSVESIGSLAFYNCTGLTSITIADSVESIGSGAFYGCESLTSVEIPKNVTSIDRDAFRGCTNITDVYCYADPSKLTWKENGCNDFKSGKATICHVPAEYLDGYNTKFGSTVNVTFVGDVDMGLGEHLYGYSITLDGSIGVNFFVELTDELLESNTAEMVFTVPNGSKTDTQTLLVKDVITDDSNKVVIGSKTYYKFKCSVSAKDMASTITAQLVDGEKSGTEYTYSVKDYADYLLSHTLGNAEYANAAPLVKAMLNYGAYAQEYFGEGKPLADSYKAAMDDVSVPADFAYNDTNIPLPDGVTFEGATLSLKSETTLSLYFKGLPADTTFTCNAGNEVQTEPNGEYVVARIRGIKANELEKYYTVTFEDGSVTYNVTYNAMTYCYNVLKDDTVDDNLQNVCRALYLYAQAAKAYSE